jgi:hypothetical protein
MPLFGKKASPGQPIGAGEEVTSTIPVDKVLAMRQQGMSNNQVIQTLQREGFSTGNIFNAMSQANMKNEVDLGSGIQDQQMQSPMQMGAPDVQMPQTSQEQPQQPMPGPQPQQAMDAQPSPDFQQPQMAMPEQQMDPQPTQGDTPFYMQDQGKPQDFQQQPMMPEPQPQAMPQQMPMGAPEMPSSQFGLSPESQRIEELAEAIIDEKWNEIVRSINKIIDWKERVESRITKLEQQLQDTRKEFDALHKGVLGKISEYDKSLTNVGTDIKAMEKVFQKVLPTLTENVNELSRIKDKLKD